VYSYQKKPALTTVQQPTLALFLPRDLDPHFDPEKNGFPGLVVKHFCVTFGDHSCIGFRDIVRKQTDRQTPLKPYPATTVGVGNYYPSLWGTLCQRLPYFCFRVFLDIFYTISPCSFSLSCVFSFSSGCQSTFWRVD